MPLSDRLWDFVGRFDPFAKPFHRLVLADLKRFPIWEGTLDTEGIPWRDETWVRPLKRATVPWSVYSLTVAAELTVRSGETFDGTAYVTTVNDEVDVPMGTIVIATKWYSIPNPGQWRETEKCQEIVAALKSSMEAIFPIRWRLKVPMEGERTTRSGEFAGDSSGE